MNEESSEIDGDKNIDKQKHFEEFLKLDHRKNHHNFGSANLMNASNHSLIQDDKSSKHSKIQSIRQRNEKNVNDVGLEEGVIGK